MAQDGPECPRMAQDGPGWPRKAQDGPGWPRMAQDGPGRCSKNASKYACSWGPPREDSRNAINSQYACSGLQNASKYVCSWGPPRKDSRNASKYTCSWILPGRTPGTLVNTHVRDPRHDTTRDNKHTHTHTHNQKNANEQTETTKGTSRSFFKIREKQPQKTSNNFPQLIKNQSKMNPGAPPETPRARDLFLNYLLMFFGPKWSPKWNKNRYKKYVICACFVDTFCLRLLNEKLSLLTLSLNIFETLGTHANDAAV